MAEKSLNKDTAKAVPEEETPRVTETAAPKKPKQEKPGCRVYIGPSIRGRVQYGAVFSSAQEARQVLVSELEVWPMLAGLLVPLEELASARAEAKTPGTARYVMAAQGRAGLTNH